MDKIVLIALVIIVVLVVAGIALGDSTGTTVLVENAESLIDTACKLGQSCR